MDLKVELRSHDGHDARQEDGGFRMSDTLRQLLRGVGESVATFAGVTAGLMSVFEHSMQQLLQPRIC